MYQCTLSFQCNACLPLAPVTKKTIQLLSHLLKHKQEQRCLKLTFSTSVSRCVWSVCEWSGLWLSSHLFSSSQPVRKKEDSMKLLSLDELPYKTHLLH